jgi:CBS domain-containing protein
VVVVIRSSLRRVVGAAIWRSRERQPTAWPVEDDVLSRAHLRAAIAPADQSALTKNPSPCPPGHDHQDRTGLRAARRSGVEAMHDRSVMSSNVRTAQVDDVVGPLRDLMMNESIHAIPVLDEKHDLAGIITSSDLVEEWAPQMGVRTVMSPDVVTIGPYTTVVDAARTMLEHRVHHLVVIERDKVAGVLSSFDLLRHIAGGAEPVASAAAAATGTLHAEVGDVLVVMPKHVGDRERRATVVQVHGSGGTAPFTVRWSDDPHDEPHLTMFFPSSDTYVETTSGDS